MNKSAENMLSHNTLERLTVGGIDIHRHWEAYATIVRRGLYVEAAVEGRLTIDPGTIVLHPRFHLHSDAVSEAGAVWNVAMGGRDVSPWRALKGAAAERLAARDTAPHPDEVLEVIERAEEIDFEPLPSFLNDIVRLDFADFADAQQEVSREHAHRTFKRYFNMPPGQYRRERQLQKAIRLLDSHEALARVAIAAGFSDQSHMTRLMVSEIGLTPARLRDKITPVQDSR